MLYQRLKDKKPSVAFHAACSLVRIDPIVSRQRIMEYLHYSDELSVGQKVRLMKDLKLEEMDSEGLISFFVCCPDSIKPNLIEATVLSSLAQSAPLIRRAASHPDKEVRIAAFKAASFSKLDIRTKEFSAGLQDPAWEVRAQAAKAAGISEDQTLIPFLTDLLSDSNWWVRQNSGKALAKMGSMGIKALSNVIQHDTDLFARDTARLALSEVFMFSDSATNDYLQTTPIPSIISPTPSSPPHTLASTFKNFKEPQTLELNTIDLSALARSMKNK